MPGHDDIALMAHLMRRAGFGASREELEARVAQGYEATVEELLHPERQAPVDEEVFYRYFPNIEGPLAPPQAQANWVYRMINTLRPLEEKMALFWHQLFATGNSKVDNPPELVATDRHVPPPWAGQFSHPAGGTRQKPGHDLLAGQQRQS